MASAPGCISSRPGWTRTTSSRRGSSSSRCRGAPGRRPGFRTLWPGSSANDGSMRAVRRNGRIARPACAGGGSPHVKLTRDGSQRYIHLLRPKRTWPPTMSTIELVDPELRYALALWPQVSLTAETLTRRRADALALLRSIPTPDLPDIATGEIHVESAFGAKPIRVLTYRPIRSDDPLPAIVHIHGGGFVMGTPEMKDGENRLLASELKCAIYSVDYRLAPEAPHPAPLEDIYSVFVWLHANAGQLE